MLDSSVLIGHNRGNMKTELRAVLTGGFFTSDKDAQKEAAELFDRGYSLSEIDALLSEDTWDGFSSLDSERVVIPASRL